MRKLLYGLLGLVSAVAGVFTLPYLFMGFDELADALRGQLPENFPKWDPYAVIALMAHLCFGAFFMSFRLLRYAFTSGNGDRMKHIGRGRPGG